MPIFDRIFTLSPTRLVDPCIVFILHGFAVGITVTHIVIDKTIKPSSLAAPFWYFLFDGGRARASEATDD